MAKVSFIPEQFLLWILYIDASCRPIGLTESLNDYVAQSGYPALQPDHLHRCARLWGRCFWGEQYPDEEVLDDIENYRALELLHAGTPFPGDPQHQRKILRPFRHREICR
ncbi:hypothetical protein ACN42_g7460 [Penicillium freii]|uniref:Uncharacterized protein n=1 Tax=Penicillium freii TaxID=48697 RepID=A0A101MFK5_PENFR|nr:hypothetical protein ACN42_g7460 [Penicillium freii]